MIRELTRVNNCSKRDQRKDKRYYDRKVISVWRHLNTQTINFFKEKI